MKLTAKEQEIVDACRLQRQYSGESSDTFWKEVSDKANDRTLYDFACALQDIEHRVLALVNEGLAARVAKQLMAARIRKRKVKR